MQYRKLHDGRKISNIGFGLYKGQISQKYDQQLIKCINYGIKKGVNVIDTAQKYRDGRSEKILKKIKSIKKSRKNFILISKVGLVADYVKKKNILKKLKVKKEDCLPRNDFCIDPQYINWSLDNSLKLTGLEYIDFYLLHNPEYALQLKNGFKKIINALKILEKKRSEGKIHYYGIATWSGLRRFKGNKNRLDLYKILKKLNQIFGKHHGFRCLEAPLSIAMPDILNHKISKKENLFKFLNKNKINFFTSATLYEGNLNKFQDLNKIYNSSKQLKDSTNELNQINITFPKSENSIRRLFILLENLKNNSINLEVLSKKFSKSKDIIGLTINFIKILNDIKCNLIGMEKKEFVLKNIRELNHQLKSKEKSQLKKIWKKIQKNL